MTGQISRAMPVMLLILLSLFLASLTKVTHMLDDTFHEGEYLGFLWHMQSYYLGKVQFPLMTHGAMDFIPSLMAFSIYGTDRVIVGTRVINVLIVMITWTFFLDICRRIVSLNKASPGWLLLPAAFLLIVSSRLDNALLLHGGVMGTRDLFLMMCIWGALSYETRSTPFARIAYLSVVAAAAALALYWAYDRGLMAVIFGFIFSAGLLVRGRIADSIILAVLACVAFFAIDYLGIFGGFGDLARNIEYWLTYGSSIWSQPLTARKIAYLSPLIILFISVFPCLWLAFRDKTRSTDQGGLVILLGLVAIELLLLRKVLNRPEGQHLAWAIWPPFAIYLFCASRLVPDSVFASVQDALQNALSGIRKTPLRRLAAPVLLLSVCLFFYLSFLHSSSSFLYNMARPLPDSGFISNELKNVSAEFSRLEKKCFFGWINEGAIPYLAQLPYCTRFPYAVFVSSEFEDYLLKELETSRPDAIVYGSRKWSMNIDGKAMDARLPLISSFILKNYPHERVVGSYVIRYR